MLEDNYKHKGRRNKLMQQLQQKGIVDRRVLRAIGAVPRHLFMDSAFEGHAYQDKAFAIGEGQTISQPYTVAFQTSLLALQPGHKVLEIGTGSGYQAAILMEMGVELFTIEFNKILHRRSKVLLRQMGYKPRMIQGDGSVGLKSKAPFDRILATAGAPSIPQALVEQLTVGGILVIPVGNEQSQEMLRIRRTSEKQVHKEEHGSFAFVKLIGKQGWQINR